MLLVLPEGQNYFSHPSSSLVSAKDGSEDTVHKSKLSLVPKCLIAAWNIRANKAVLVFVRKVWQ